MAESLTESSSSELFTSLYEENYRRLWYYFLQLRVDMETARDLAQETFLRAHRGWSDFRMESSRETWLFEIARNIYKNWMRDQASLRHKRIELSIDGSEDEREGLVELPSAEVGADEAVINSEKSKLVREAVAALPPMRRRAVELRLQDRGYDEIAAILGVSIQTVKSHLYQAREALRSWCRMVEGEPASKKSNLSGRHEADKATRSKQGSPSQLNDSQRRALELYRDHGSMRRVAAELGCSAMWVSKLLKSIPEEIRQEAGVSVRSPGYARAWEKPAKK